MAASGKKQIAQKSDWMTEDMPEKNATIQLNVAFKEEEMDAIKLGTVPQEMEGKWFIYYVESESKLYMHRSWTGMCIYIVSFEKIEGGYAAVSAVVNRDISSHTSVDEKYEKEICMEVIGAVLLGQFGSVGTPVEKWAMLGKHSLQPNDNRLVFTNSEW